jgi:hypothetical protein
VQTERDRGFSSIGKFDITDIYPSYGSDDCQVLSNSECHGSLDGSDLNTAKATSVAGRGMPWGYEPSRLSHFLGTRLADDGEVDSLTRRPPFSPQEDSWLLFLSEARVRLEGSGKLETQWPR